MPILRTITGSRKFAKMQLAIRYASLPEPILRILEISVHRCSPYHYPSVIENMVKIIHEELFAGIISIPNFAIKFLSLGTNRSEQTDPDQYKVVQD